MADEKREKTAYIVLKEANLDRVGIDETWDVFQTGVQAHNSADAVKQVAKDAGVYVAVPERSFNPTKVMVETQTVVRLGETT